MNGKIAIAGIDDELFHSRQMAVLYNSAVLLGIVTGDLGEHYRRSRFIDQEVFTVKGIDAVDAAEIVSAVLVPILRKALELVMRQAIH